MAEHEIRTVTTLTNKRDEIIRVISRYERKLEQARADLAAIKAAIVVFQKPTGTADAYAYSGLGVAVQCPWCGGPDRHQGAGGDAEEPTLF